MIVSKSHYIDSAVAKYSSWFEVTVYNGTFMESWNSFNLHSNFFNYPNKQEAETFGVFIHVPGSKQSKQT